MVYFDEKEGLMQKIKWHKGNPPTYGTYLVWDDGEIMVADYFWEDEFVGDQWETRIACRGIRPDYWMELPEAPCRK